MLNVANKPFMLSVIELSVVYDEYHCAECHYASVIMLSVVMLSVIIMSVVMLTVVAPLVDLWQ